MALVLSFDEVFQGDEDGEAEDPVTCASVNICTLEQADKTDNLVISCSFIQPEY